MKKKSANSRLEPAASVLPEVPNEKRDELLRKIANKLPFAVASALDIVLQGATPSWNQFREFVRFKEDWESYSKLLNGDIGILQRKVIYDMAGPVLYNRLSQTLEREKSFLISDRVISYFIVEHHDDEAMKALALGRLSFKKWADRQFKQYERDPRDAVEQAFSTDSNEPVNEMVKHKVNDYRSGHSGASMKEIFHEVARETGKTCENISRLYYYHPKKKHLP